MRPIQQNQPDKDLVSTKVRKGIFHFNVQNEAHENLDANNDDWKYDSRKITNRMLLIFWGNVIWSEQSSLNLDAVLIAHTAPNKSSLDEARRNGRTTNWKICNKNFTPGNAWKTSYMKELHAAWNVGYNIF